MQTVVANDGVLKKIVYEDDGRSKVVKCYILKEDEFVYRVRTLNGDNLVIGKRAIIKVSDVGDNNAGN